jgi:hypothetical protein
MSSYRAFDRCPGLPPGLTDSACQELARLINLDVPLDAAVWRLNKLPTISRLERTEEIGRI